MVWRQVSIVMHTISAARERIAQSEQEEIVQRMLQYRPGGHGARGRSRATPALGLWV